MITSKYFALGTVLISTLASARVQISSDIHIDRPLLQAKRHISTEIQLDEHKFLNVYDSDHMRVEIRLLEQKEKVALIRCSVFIKDADGNFELLLAPQLLASYDNTATITLGEKSAQGEQITSFSWVLEARKV